MQAITEQKWTLRVALYEAVDMSLSNTGLFGQEVRPKATFLSFKRLFGPVTLARRSAMMTHQT